MVWGYARGADRRGVEIHPYTEVTGITRDNGRVTGVETNRGTIEADTVISCTAGWSTLVCDLAEVPLPITTHILQAFVTEPIKPFLDVIIVSSQMHVYVSQTDRGEILIGAEIEPYTTYKGHRARFPFLEYSATHTLELFPQLEGVKVLRRGRGSATCRRTTARSSGRPRSRASTSPPAGGRTASRPPRSWASRSPS